MAKRVQFIRHTTAQANAFVGNEGEVTIDLDNDEFRIHNGSLAGGIRQARQDLANVTAATTSADGKMTATQVTSLTNTVAGLAAELVARAAGDAAQAAYTDAETTARTADVDAEETARINADNALQANIDTEASTRASQDSTLQTNIDAKAAKVPTAVVGNFASFTADGSVQDSGAKAADYATAAHNHSGVYEPAFAKNSAFNKAFAGSGAATTISRSDHDHTGVYATAAHNHAGVYEPAFAKLTAFNKNFGTSGTTVAYGNHTHVGVYEPAFSKNTGFNKNLGTSAGTVSEGNHTHSGVYEPVFAKNTAFNKNFGSVAGTVLEGDSQDFRGCLARTGTGVTLTTAGTLDLLFTAAAYDTDSIFSVGTADLTVPTGVTRVRLTAGVTWQANATGIRRLSIEKNGTDAYDGGTSVVNAGNASGPTQNATTPVLTVTGGDTFQLEVYQNSGSTLVVGGQLTWFAMEIIE